MGKGLERLKDPRVRRAWKWRVLGSPAGGTIRPPVNRWANACGVMPSRGVQGMSRTPIAMHTLRSSLLHASFLCAAAACAQEWQWAHPGTSSANADGQAVAVDAQGNSVVTGTYHGTIDLGGQELSTPDEDGLFLAKFDPDGVLLWSHVVANSPGIAVHDITIDDAGAIALVGMYQGNVVFIPGPLGTMLTAAGSFDVFVAKFAEDGSPVWARSIGDVGWDYGASIGHDQYANLYVTGDMHQSAFEYSGSKVFVTKFAYNGVPLWTTTSAAFGSTHLGDGICVSPAGVLCITGEFFQTITFGTFTLDAGTPEATVYVTKLDADGTPLWAQMAGVGGYAFGQSVDMDAAGNAYVTGSYRGTIALGGLTLPGPGDYSYDVFVARCASADGTFQWATRGSGPGSDRAVGIRVDADGNSYINGAYADAWTFGNTTLSTNGGTDGYLAKLSPAGEALWARNYGGPTSDAIGGMALQGSAVFVTGGFQVSMQFDPGPSLTGQEGNRDVFLAKLEEAPSGIGELEDVPVVLFPNPVVEHVRLQGLRGPADYTVLDGTGHVVLAGRAVGDQAIDVRALARGAYVLWLQGKKAQRLRFVKQ